MLRIGKLDEASNEKINVTIGTLESTHFENGKKIKTTTRPELEIEIEGTIDKDSYFFNFYIDKPFEDYLKMKNYERVKIENSNIKEDFAKINGQYETLHLMNIEVLRLSTTLVFVVNMQSSFDDYFATSEFNVPLTTIENALKQD
jgi:hypothetical protein